MLILCGFQIFAKTSSESETICAGFIESKLAIIEWYFQIAAVIVVAVARNSFLDGYKNVITY